MIHTKELTEWQKAATISYLISVLSPDQKRNFMNELPQVYNALYDVEVMEVRQKRGEPGSAPTVSAVGKKEAA